MGKISKKITRREVKIVSRYWKFELSGFNCSVKGQGTYFEGLISSALITLYIPQMDSCWTILHSSSFAAANVKGLPSGC